MFLKLSLTNFSFNIKNPSFLIQNLIRPLAGGKFANCEFTTVILFSICEKPTAIYSHFAKNFRILRKTIKFILKMRKNQPSLNSQNANNPQSFYSQFAKNFSHFAKTIKSPSLLTAAMRKTHNCHLQSSSSNLSCAVLLLLYNNYLF